MDSQPSAEVVEQIKDIPIYRGSVERGHFPILEKPEIADGFPDNWMTPRLAAALDAGEAEFVLSTGTNHARMQLIRPPYFLLRSYYRLWSEHPDISGTWHQGCRRVSLTTVLATEHVARVNAARHGGAPAAVPSLDDRRLDERTVYLNLRLDPDDWDRADVERMITEMREEQRAHPRGRYHLDCSGYHLAHLVRKAVAWGLWDDVPRPASVITAYEYTPLNVRGFLERHLDCPVIDLFGSTELGYLYYSDRLGRYHPYLDRMSVELIPVEPGSRIHSLIVTSVRNPYMPLVRYRSGDCVRTADGSADPAKVSRFCGREKELLSTPNGPVSQGDLDDCVSIASPRVFLYQLVRTGTGTAVLRYTTFENGALEPSESTALEKLVGDLIGMPTTLEHGDRIPIGKSGKYAWLTQEP
jgi:phenylacetate-CoA ligase